MHLWWLVAAASGLLPPHAVKLAPPAASRPRAVSARSYRRHHRGSAVPPVGAAITVHPPKFFLLAKFLESFAACAAARDVMSVFVVFWDEGDRSAFEHGLSSWAPKLPGDAWVAVVPPAPPNRLQNVDGTQLLPSWKKWYGIAYMMDLGAAAPGYGLMLDAEVLPYNATDCGEDSQWYKLYGRIKRAEESKAWLAARVDTSKMYRKDRKRRSGQTFDQEILAEQKKFVYDGTGGANTSALLGAAAGNLDHQISETLFSWWTDLPYVNLTVAQGLLESLAAARGPIQPANYFGVVPRFRGQYLKIAEAILWPRFEHLTYQAWCVLHHGYHIKDVTQLTGTASWGSYNEAPKNGSRIGELEPMWVSASVARFAKEAMIPPLSSASPPLLVFHVDHEQHLFPVQSWRKRWENATNSH